MSFTDTISTSETNWSSDDVVDNPETALRNWQRVKLGIRMSSSGCGSHRPILSIVAAIQQLGFRQFDAPVPLHVRSGKGWLGGIRRRQPTFKIQPRRPFRPHFRGSFHLIHKESLIILSQYLCQHSSLLIFRRKNSKMSEVRWLIFTHFQFLARSAFFDLKPSLLSSKY